MTSDIRPLVAGNWKMNGTRSSLDQIRAIAHGVSGPLSRKLDALICPPATLLYVATTLTVDTRLMIGAQDCHQKARTGAHTGDISAEMIRDCFATHVIVGHSERRQEYGESNHRVLLKARAAYDQGLTAIICIGETREERAEGRTMEVLHRQLRGSLPDDATAANTIIAYEPVWAIGTGQTPRADEVAKVHARIRADLVARFGEGGETIRLLYGGSVNPGNAKELLGIPHVNGALIGGASLKAADFLSIYHAYEDILSSVEA
ncbi:triose-phosphate isomerase [Martelella endophytica]|uniref:Triosephosphate isomerase n=1 Tax=Martelella endophytica TaxID=1486262 RepID=A0A0D5LRJ5_MAREN|nr:triose-phosphate isomerase [Martelella endophytica]AJY46560.1 triosephosphate isomerase [Martelella endophytica]